MTSRRLFETQTGSGFTIRAMTHFEGLVPREMIQDIIHGSPANDPAPWNGYDVVFDSDDGKYCEVTVIVTKSSDPRIGYTHDHFIHDDEKDLLRIRVHHANYNSQKSFICIISREQYLSLCEYIDS